MDKAAFPFAILALLLLIGGTFRIVLLEHSDIMSERQYRSALIAREQYLSTQQDAPDWQVRIAEISASRMGTLEPPIMEYLSATLFSLFDRETIIIPRLMATILWLVGGYFLFLLARELTDSFSALYGVAYYLFLPLGVQVSTAFLPDSLMILLFIASLLAIVRLDHRPTAGRLIVAGVLAAACVLVKPLCIFAILIAFAFLRIQSKGWKAIMQADAIVFALLTVSPAFSYYLYGMIGTGFLERQATESFVPELLLNRQYWTWTTRTAFNALGVFPMVLAAVGFGLGTKNSFRPMMLGLSVGYLVLCLVFTYHVRIAGHYHLQLAIPVAICLGLAVNQLVQRVNENLRCRAAGIASLTVAGLVMAIFALDSTVQSMRASKLDFAPSVAMQVGETINHSDRVVYISQYYGVPLEYYGRLSGWYWPRSQSSADRAKHGREARERSVEERLSNLGTAVGKAHADFVPEYFVVTDFREYERHRDLEAYLSRECRQQLEGKGYLIYTECQSTQ
jgi:hypothetical protein